MASRRSGEFRPDQSPTTLPSVGESGRIIGSIAVSLQVTRFLIFVALAGFFRADCRGDMGMIVVAAVETVEAWEMVEAWELTELAGECKPGQEDGGPEGCRAIDWAFLMSSNART